MNLVATITPIVSGLLGVGAGYAVLKMTLKDHGARISKIEQGLLIDPSFVAKADWSRERERLEEQRRKIERENEELKCSVLRLGMVFRWILTNKFEMSLAEANEILENGGRTK